MSAEDYLPEGWESELDSVYSTDFLSPTEAKTRIHEDEMEKMSILEETLCPDCGEKMISRKSQHGIFWGCSQYPKCKGTRDSQGRSKADRAKEKGETYEKDENDTFNKFSFKRTI